MLAFVPAYSGIVVYGFFVCVAPAAYFATRKFLRFATTSKTLGYFFQWAKTDLTSALLSLCVAALAVYSFWPRLFDYREVTNVAKPGMPFSTVVEQLGRPTWKSVKRNGDTDNGFDTGLVVGSVIVTVSPDGIVKTVGFAD